MTWKTLAIALAFSAAPLAAAAQEALYDPAPPPGSAFVRFVDAAMTGAPGALAGAEMDLSGDGVSNFVVVPEGAHEVTLGDTAASAEFAAGHYYTVVFNETGSAGPEVIRDDVLTNPAKAGLHFYNLTGEDGLSLTAPQQNVAIFEDVAAGEMKFRPVGAVDVGLAVVAGGRTVAEVGEVRLERRTAKSVMVMAAAGGLTAVVVDNVVDR